MIGSFNVQSIVVETPGNLILRDRNTNLDETTTPRIGLYAATYRRQTEVLRDDDKVRFFDNSDTSGRFVQVQRMANPLVNEAITVTTIAGITGSASGGMSIALQTPGPTYAGMARAEGVSPEILRRVAALASGGFDSLPRNGAVITLLAICGLCHRESYVDIGVVSVVIPLLARAMVLVLFGTF
jgi:hypothetical protein